MEKEFNLSEKIQWTGERKVLDPRHIKEFIKLLKEEIKERGWFCNNAMIDKLAGDKLN